MDTYNQPSEIFPDQGPAVYGGFWERFAAAFLDGLIIGIPVAIIQYMLGEFGNTEYSGDLFRAYFSLGNLISIVASWLYAALMESSPGQATIGKKALGLKVTTTDGGRISFGQATGRHFGKWLSAILLLIGYLMMLWDDRKQTLHDKMAGTLVVKR